MTTMQRTRLDVTVEGATDGASLPTIVAARFTIRYQFEDATIIVEDIPGRWDREHERELVSGAVASGVQQLVARLREVTARVRQQEGEQHALGADAFADTPVRVRASDFLPAA